MGVFVYLPLVLPLTALPIARLAEQHLHPRRAARLLTTVAVILATCSLVCLGLLVVVGTAQLPGNPLPDGWSDDEVREAVPHDAFAGKASIVALVVVAAACGYTVHRHYRFRARAHRALAGLRGDGDVAVLPDDVPYAYALPGSPGRVMVSTAMLASSNRPSTGRCSPTSGRTWPDVTTGCCSRPGWPAASTPCCGRCSRPSSTAPNAGPTRRPPGSPATDGSPPARSARRHWSPARYPAARPSPPSRRRDRCRAGWRPSWARCRRTGAGPRPSPRPARPRSSPRPGRPSRRCPR